MVSLKELLTWSTEKRKEIAIFPTERRKKGS